MASSSSTVSIKDEALPEWENNSIPISSEGEETDNDKSILQLTLIDRLLSSIVTEEDLKSLQVVKNQIYDGENDALEYGNSFKMYRAHEEYDEEDYDDKEYYEEHIDQEYDHEDNGNVLVDNLCLGMTKMDVKNKTTSKLKGQHLRFVYDSDDDTIVDKIKVFGKDEADSSGLMTSDVFSTPKENCTDYYDEDEED